MRWSLWSVVFLALVLFTVPAKACNFITAVPVQAVNGSISFVQPVVGSSVVFTPFVTTSFVNNFVVSPSFVPAVAVSNVQPLFVRGGRVAVFDNNPRFHIFGLHRF